MTSKHTKRGRKARRRAHHEGIAAEAWDAYQGRLLTAALDRASRRLATGTPGFITARAMYGLAWWGQR